VTVRSHAPVRIDFAGGWTDVDIFARGAGGAVLNAAINRYVEGEMWTEDPDGSAAGPQGISVTYRSDLPSGSGLGTSAALNVAWLGLIRAEVTGAEEKAEIAELAYRLEEMLGILGGRQDQYAAALGGIRYYTFGHGVQVHAVDIDSNVLAALERDLLLCYTGRPRLSGRIHEHVWGNYRNGVRQTVEALYALRDIAAECKAALEAGDLPAFGALLSRNWASQKALHDSVSNPEIEALFGDAFSRGAVGGKACGAGGGGCLLFLCNPGARGEVAAKLVERGARIIDFRFDHEGLVLSHS
jgi:D-glycero-alpha-D-manno-heptose-7-phosphate kinase